MISLVGQNLPVSTDIRAALERGAVVVTANARAARALRLAHAERQRTRGVEVWPTVTIFDWESWLAALWQQASMQFSDAPLLLTRLQEHALWKQMQREDAALVVSPDNMATLAQEAWSLLSQYEGHAARNYPWQHTDAERFRHWAATFDAECRKSNWASRSSLELLLTEAVPSAIPDEVLLVGFDRITPAQKSFLQACEERGSAFGYHEPQRQSTTKRLIVAEDLRDEITACAWWSRDMLTRDADCRIGVITPDVGSVRAEMDRIFRRVLMPESVDIAAAPSTMPYEFSLGVPLASVPVIKAALLLLKWAASPLLEEEVTWLVLSGYFAANGAEMLALARFDAGSRDAGALSPEVPLKLFFARLSVKSGELLSGVRGHVHGFLDSIARNRIKTQSRRWSQWAEAAQAMLKAAGWPGHRDADSEQFQAEQRWLDLLDQVALLDFDGSRVDYRTFLRTLQAQAGSTVFSPESHHAPVQILGALESSGQQFDAVWFLGADDQQWPSNGRPHPLLPLGVQQGMKMPHAARDLDWQLARAVTQRIADSAPVCIFSYARTAAATEHRPSPLLADLSPADGAIKASSLREELGIPTEIHASPTLESVIDDSGRIAWPMAESAGGSEVLKQQAACPFRAFVSVRLRARPLNRTEWGFSAAERGSILHSILRNLWAEETPPPLRLRSLDDVKAANASGLMDTVLTHHISAVFAPLVQQHSADTWLRVYLDAEQQRLTVRLKEWLDCEAVRQPFTVASVEQELQDVDVGGLKLRLRADRIDRLPDGGHLLIDYKTGVVATKSWEGERPDEPQLPLYALFGGVEDVRGLLFAQIRAGCTGFAGHVTNAKGLLRADLEDSSALVKSPYDETMREEWAEALVNLAEDFVRGEAAVDPKHGSKTCKYCPLPGLCRVAETQLSSTEDDEEVVDE